MCVWRESKQCSGVIQGFHPKNPSWGHPEGQAGQEFLLPGCSGPDLVGDNLRNNQGKNFFAWMLRA